MAKRIPKPSDNGMDDTHTLDMFELETQGFSQQAAVVAETQKVERVEREQDRTNLIANAAKVVDIVERAKIIADEIRYADIKKVRQGDIVLALPEPTDTNKRIVLDYLFRDADSKPHFDEFRGRIVGHDDVVMDDFYSGTTLLNAFNAVGLRKLKLKEVIEAARAYALDHRRNDLSLRVESMVPKWDGVARLDSALIRMFDSFDTDLNRAFGVYFWTSLFMRVTRPGEEAPIVLTLIGAQNGGKSYFGKLLARTLTGDAEADSVQLNLDAKTLDFLRDITGFSPICAIGEMAGYQRADVNKLKNWITRTHDQLNQKFEGTVHQARQWICIADANRYEGLLRDDTGNRRFYPLFCGQIETPDGGTGWRENFKANFDDFENEFWQLMAEAKTWVEANGVDGYRRMVRDVSQQVFAFSQAEAKAGRGVVKDDSVLPFVPAALDSAPCREIKARKGDGSVYVFYDRVDLVAAIQQAAGTIDPTRERRFLKDLEKACGMLGDGVPAKRDCGKVPGFAFYHHPSKASLLAAIGANGERDDVKVISGTPREQVTGF